MAPKPVSPFARFKRADTTMKQRIIAASFGEVGTLKTSFWLTAPSPILFQSLDRGLEGVVGAPILGDYASKEIHVEEYESNTDALDQDGAIEVRDKIVEDFAYAIENGIRTIVWDKETQLYEVFKYAEFGAPSSNPKDYYALDQRYRRLINMAKSSDINFGIIQGMKTPWETKVNKSGVEKGQPRYGVRERRGMREIDELVHINIEHFLGEDEKFFMKIGKARGPGGHEIQNKVLPYVTFPEFASLVFPDTDPDVNWV